MLRTSMLLGLAFLLLTGPVERGDACCMVPRTYEGDVDQSMQEVVVAFHEGREELILRVRPFFQGADAPPASLAWLVTVPTTPDTYKVAQPAIFEDARGLANRLLELEDEQRPKPVDGPFNAYLSADGAVKQESQGLEIGERVEVGPYEITPVRARGTDAVGELNRYLAAHEFGTEDPAHLAWFAENEFTFLCIKITPPEGAATLGKHLELDPLHLSFASDKPYYPGKYSANQGNFALALTLLTTKPVLRASLADTHARLHSWMRSEGNLFTTKALPGALADAAGDVAPERWYVNRFQSRGFNPPSKEGVSGIHAWKDDVTWTLGGDADLPPRWYYGDGPRPLWHTNDTRTVLQWLLWAVFILVPLGIIWLLIHHVGRALRRRAQG